MRSINEILSLVCGFFNRERIDYVVVDADIILRLDLKGIYKEVDKRTFEHRVSFNYSGTTLYLASPEDTIANKLARSEQDIKDAEGIYVWQMEKLDMRYFLEMKKRIKKYLRELKE